MAAKFLRGHGIDLDAELARIQHAAATPSHDKNICIRNVALPGTEKGTRWDVSINHGAISNVRQHDPATPTHYTGTQSVAGNGALLAPSLCHPHIHIDKAYLLSHPNYSDLVIESGDFKEAMTLTGQAKARFEETDLLQRGQRVIDESIAAGVTHMRAFVEVDVGVGTKCLDAGIKLKQKAEQEGKCHIQICAFAQLPLFSDASAAGEQDPKGEIIRQLMHEAAAKSDVGALGSTPYVEDSQARMRQNVDWMIDLTARTGKHLDFHLDYHLDADTEPLVWYVVDQLKAQDWSPRMPGGTVVLGHCTRLTMFTQDEWQRLHDQIVDLPISFVGLPTSDLFMMRASRAPRGTLDVPRLIRDYDLNACIGINNIGNAFTPHGSCDPLTLACNGIGIYQAGSMRDTETLYECISTRARKAIGLGNKASLDLAVGDRADLLLFGSEREEWSTRSTVPEVVYLYDHARERRAFHAGVSASHSDP